MMQCNQWVPEDSEKGFEDYSLYVYRQTASEFNDRVKELEMKLLYPVRQIFRVTNNDFFFVCFLCKATSFSLN